MIALPLNLYRDVNAQDANGFTVLHQAVLENSVDTIQILLNCLDLNFHLEDEKQMTPLNLAVLQGKTDIARLLLQHPNCNINSVESDGHTVLHQAVALGKIDAINTLLEQPNCNINAKNLEERTPLHLTACFYNHNNIAALLLKHPNININAQDSNGETALLLAVDECRLDIVQSLLNHGASLSIKNKKNESVFDRIKLESHDKTRQTVKNHLLTNSRLKNILDNIIKDSDDLEDVKYKFNDYLCHNFFQLLKIDEPFKILPLEITNHIAQNLTVNDIKFDLNDPYFREIYQIYECKEFILEEIITDYIY